MRTMPIDRTDSRVISLQMLMDALIPDRYPTQVAMAEDLGINATHLSQMKKGFRTVGNTSATRIERGLGLAPAALDRPDEIRALCDALKSRKFPGAALSELAAMAQKGQKTAADRAAAFVDNVHRVPVISWDDARMAKLMFDEGRSGGVPTVPYVGPHTGGRLIAMYQDDESMTAPSGALSFPPGTEYIIDIDADPRPGKDYVLVQGESRAYLRRLVDDIGGRRLLPLNPQFAPIADTGEYLGVMVCAKADIFRRT